MSDNLLEYWVATVVRTVDIIDSDAGTTKAIFDGQAGLARNASFADCQLAAAAPAMRRTLLSLEWVKMDGAERMCPRCRAVNGMYKPYGGYDGHELGCSTDTSLTSSGLPDQASRDAARRRLGF